MMVCVMPSRGSVLAPKPGPSRAVTRLRRTWLHLVYLLLVVHTYSFFKPDYTGAKLLTLVILLVLLNQLGDKAAVQFGCWRKMAQERPGFLRQGQIHMYTAGYGSFWHDVSSS